VHQERAQECRQPVAPQHVAQRPDRVLHAAHPAVAGQGHEHQRRPEQGEPQPRLRRRTDRAAVTERPHHRTGDELADDEHQQPDGERQPRRLHPLADRGAAAAGAVQPGGPGRRAVGQEGQLPGDLGEHDAGDRQAGERHGAEPADDGGVDEQVQRLGRQHRQRGTGQPQHLAQRDPVRPAHSWAARGRRQT
jgi:hypothetical protein